jgi:hypothetical protein
MKIAKVINTCLDCQYFVAVQHKESTYFGICDFSRETKEEIIEYQPMILIRAHDAPRHYKMDIPENCPLEDYKAPAK